MYFEKLREALGRYAAGVHEVGAPASAEELRRAVARLGRALPPELVELYRSWDGLRLFCDSFTLVEAASVALSGELLRIGEALGAPLFLDEKGRIFEADEAGDLHLVGSSIEKWLGALMAREALLVDREGEWKEVFSGGALRSEVRVKRMRAGLKADPDAAAWHEEAAELAFEAGDSDEAVRALEQAVAADPKAGAAWALLGGLRRLAGNPAEAERSFVRAAEASGDPARRRDRFAEAARAAVEAGDEPARARDAARALAAGEAFAEEWLAEARAREADGDVDGALNRATLVAALVPGGDADALARRLRARIKLRPIA